MIKRTKNIVINLYVSRMLIRVDDALDGSLSSSYMEICNIKGGVH